MENPSPTQFLTSALQPRNAPNFTFITITNPKDIKDANKQTAIRRQARTNAGKTKPKRAKPVKLTFDLPVHTFPPKSEQQLMPAEKAVEEVIHQEDPSSQEIHRISLKAQTLLSLSTHHPPRVPLPLRNPLSSFPLHPTPRMRQLISYLHDSMEKTPRPLGPIWFTVGMADKSAFQLTLGNAAYCFYKETGNYRGEVLERGETGESIGFYTAAMKGVERRLGVQGEGVSEGIVGCVLGFACHDHQTGNTARSKIHMDGLEKIIKIRGGYETLKPFHILRLMLFWIDTNDSFAQDTAPRFPLPLDLILADFPQPHSFSILDSITAEWNRIFPSLGDVTTSLTSLARLCTFINEKTNSPSDTFWRDDWFMSRRYVPILHTLLSLPRHVLSFESEQGGLVLREAIRLTSLLLIALTHRKFSISPDQATFYYSLITSLLTENRVNWFPFLDLKLWVLVVAGSVSEGRERTWYVGEIWDVMGELGLEKVCDVMGVVKGVVWVEVPLEEGLAGLVRDLQSCLDGGVVGGVVC